MSSEGEIAENPEEISSMGLLSPACTLLVSQRKIDFNLVCTLCSAPNQHEWKLFGANVWVGVRVFKHPYSVLVLEQKALQLQIMRQVES